MARELTPEQIAERRKNQQQSEEAGGSLGDGAFLENWKPDKREANSIDVIVHAGCVIHELHRHAYKEVVTVRPKNKPPYRMLVTRYGRCMESEGWHRFLRMRKEQAEPPKCALERLINHLAARIDRDPAFKDEVLFRFGVGCVDKEGKATPVEEFTAGDICDLTGGQHGWKKTLKATQRRLLVVVPWRTNDGAKTYEDASPKIAMESWKLVEAFVKEKKRAMGRFGDAADPTIKPAVYRITADRTNPKSFGPEFTVSFLSEVRPDDLPGPVQEAWANDLSADLQNEIKAALTPLQPGVVLRCLQDALVADLDLEQVCGYKVAAAPAQRPQREEAAPEDDYDAPAPSRPAAPAPSAGGGSRGIKGKPAAPAQAAAEPCPECGTPWPKGAYACPGNCGATDDEVPAPAAASGEVADDDGIPF